MHPYCTHNSYCNVMPHQALSTYTEKTFWTQQFTLLDAWCPLLLFFIVLLLWTIYVSRENNKKKSMDLKFESFGPFEFFFLCFSFCCTTVSIAFFRVISLTKREATLILIYTTNILLQILLKSFASIDSSSIFLI